MIEVFDAKNVFDIMYDYAERNNCALLYFTNDSLDHCQDQDLIDKVYKFYEEILPEDMLLILKTKHNNIIEFKSEDSAKMNASAWFPERKYVDSDEYYFKCYVIDQSGYIVFEN
jgi:hypothetical protein